MLTADRLPNLDDFAHTDRRSPLDGELMCDECEGEGRILGTEDCWSHASQTHYTRDVWTVCACCAGTGCVPDPEHECSECHDFGGHVRVIDAIGDDPVCPCCYHVILAEALDDAASRVPREIAKPIRVLVRLLHDCARDRDRGDWSLGYAFAILHALDATLDLLPREMPDRAGEARLACAWKLALHLGPREEVSL